MNTGMLECWSGGEIYCDRIGRDGWIRWMDCFIQLPSVLFKKQDSRIWASIYQYLVFIHRVVFCKILHLPFHSLPLSLPPTLLPPFPAQSPPNNSTVHSLILSTPSPLIALTGIAHSGPLQQFFRPLGCATSCLNTAPRYPCSSANLA